VRSLRFFQSQFDVRALNKNPDSNKIAYILLGLRLLDERAQFIGNEGKDVEMVLVYLDSDMKIKIEQAKAEITEGF
jgi:hypothetical protein